MPILLSVNIGVVREAQESDVGVTGIDKRPVSEPVQVRAPGPQGIGGSGLIGDPVCELRFHGGDDMAVYAYAREDLDMWATELQRELPSGTFGENLTTSGISTTDALIGERWQIGDQVVLEVAQPRIPCRVFADWLGERGWVKTFTQRAVPGAYLRVITPGTIQAGDALTVIYRPGHEVTNGLVFRALTLERELLTQLLAADALPEEIKQRARAKA